MHCLSIGRTEHSKQLCDHHTTLLLQAAAIGGGTDSDVNPFAAFGVSGPPGPSLPSQGGGISLDTTTTTTTNTTSTADLLSGLDSLAGVGNSGVPFQAPTVQRSQPQGDNHSTAPTLMFTA